MRTSAPRRDPRTTDTLRRGKKTSIYLEPELDEALARRAADEGLTKAEFIRRTLAGAVQRPRRGRPEAVGPPDDAAAHVAAHDERRLAARRRCPAGPTPPSSARPLAHAPPTTN